MRFIFQKRCTWFDNPSFISVDKSETIDLLVKNICSENWYNAAFMHITPLIHAEECGIENFWSIDADVCHVCLSEDRILEMLSSAASYADEQNINLFSLDIWSSLVKHFNGHDYWSFGITYVRDNKKVLKNVRQHINDDGFVKMKKLHVEIYLNYLTTYELVVGNFYFENLQFILYGDDFFARPCSKGLYKYSDGKITFPLIYYCIGAKSRGRIPIADNVARLDIGIGEREGAEELIKPPAPAAEKTYFYLKINRRVSYTFRNLQEWVRIVNHYPNGECIIICDNEWLKNEVLNRIDFYNEPKFITSIINEETKNIAKAVCDDYWEKAALAHITSFYHARENGVKEFWNIDADDTLFCCTPDRVVQVLKQAKYYANNNDVAIFSLDMWWSFFKGKHWSFGITYTNNKINWLEYMALHCHDGAYKDFPRVTQCLDWFFTYILKLNEIRMGIFYVENLKFIHYGNDFPRAPFASGMSHWKNGYLHYPLVEHYIGAKEAGVIPVATGAVKVDVGITNEETVRFLSEYAVDDIPLNSDDFKEE